MIGGVIWIVYWVGYGMYQGKKIRYMNEIRVQQREERFRNNPNLLDCLVLLDNYYWDFQQQEKALYYGEYCIKLGVDDTRRSWYVHMILAKIYAKNRNLEKACYHIGVALKAAERDKVPESHIKELRIQDLIDSCKNKQNGSVLKTPGKLTDRCQI